jgi:predicted ATPase/DNA-binding SARP family transcriptional activator/Tfp pilus assembly protein PilF
VTDVRLLGPLEAGPPTAVVRVGAAKPRALLAALALSPGLPVSTDVLIDTLWGEDPPSSAGKLLHVYVSQLRKVLPADVTVTTTPPGYTLDVPAERVDAARFAALVEAGQRARSDGALDVAISRLTEALGLWRGEALADVGPALLFDTEAHRLNELRLSALVDFYGVRLDLGEGSDVVDPLRGLVEQQPLHEGLRRSLIIALYRAGRQADALAEYDSLRVRLRDELGVDPGPAIRELHRQLLSQHEDLDATAPARAAAVPTPLTPTIGRDETLAALDALLSAGTSRLLTLTGPGGSGKTRLALVAAGRAQAHYAHGAVLVALETVHDPHLALTTVAAALGLSDAGPDPVGSLADHLAARELLVVLDNLEQVVDVGAALGELLTRAPGLTLLVTSRILLGIRGEHAFPVPPLTVPASPDNMSEIAANPAVALFCERAAAALGSFELTRDNAWHVAELCQHLEGLPLAIELAAAQSRVLDPAELLTRLRSRLGTIGPGQRDRPARHQSLRSALEGSYELLSEPARALLASSSAFVGGFDLAAAEAVCGAGVAALSELVDHSLIQSSPLARRRFTMLETIREFAAEALDDASVKRRHAAYFLALAEDAAAELDGAQQAARLAQLDVEHGNLRCAFATFREAGDAEGELRLAVALARFWYIRGHLSEGRLRLSGALERAATLPPRLRADALRKISANAMLRGDYEEALDLANEALSIYDELGDAVGRARSLSNIGAFTHASGDLRLADATLTEAIRLARQIGAVRVTALALNNHGDLCLSLGDYPRATELFTESLALLEQQSDMANVARSLLNLALAALGRGADDEADTLVQRGLDVAVRVDDVEDIAWCLLAQGSLLARRGDHHRAALLVGAAESVLHQIDASLKPYERALHAATAQALEESLGTEAFSDARSRGSALPLADAIALAGG